MSIGPSIPEIRLFQNLTLKIKGQGHGQAKNQWLHLMLRIQSICLLFILWQWNHFWLRYGKFLTLKIKGQGHGHGQISWSHLRPRVQTICLFFVSWESHHFWLRYSKFHIWPWKFQGKVKAKVKSDGHIWSLGFNRYVCFFASWQSDHFWLR